MLTTDTLTERQGRGLTFAGRTILILSPHPDDEVLGCGGLISRAKAEGARVYVLFLAIGNTREFTSEGRSTDDERMAEIKKVAEFLDYDGWRIAYQGDRYHLRLDTVAQLDLISEIEAGPDISLQALRPDILLVPQAVDYNQDHRACTDAAFAAARPAPDGVKALTPVVLGYESVPAEWSPSPPAPRDCFVALDEQDVQAKIDALLLYRSQVRPGHHLRSPEAIRTLADLRGRQSGVPRAEAFVTYRVLL